MLYPILIVISTLLVALINILSNAFSLSWWMHLVFACVCTVCVIGIDGLFAFLIRRMPEKWFNHEKSIYNVSKREIAFYKFLQIKKWKDRVPELGGFTSFHKNKVEDPTSSEYLERFLLEIDYGFIIHIVSVPAGFLIMLLDYKIFLGSSMTIGLSIALPIAIINGILNLMPAFILRYNYPRLKMLLKMSKRKK